MRLFIFAAVAACLLPGVAAAQDTPKLALVVGYPAQVGLLWNLSEKVAIRPEVNWTHSTSESPGTSTTFGPAGSTTVQTTLTSQSTAFGVGISGLIHVWRQEALRVYLSPRFTYTHQSMSIDLGLPVTTVVPVLTQSTTNTYGVAGSLGAQYTLARHFGLFGEVGVAYTRATISTDAFILTSGENSTVGLRSGAGVLLFF
jgi:hypothetical protein